jgi:hypothetical protein
MFSEVAASRIPFGDLAGTGSHADRPTQAFMGSNLPERDFLPVSAYVPRLAERAEAMWRRPVFIRDQQCLRSACSTPGRR